MKKTIQRLFAAALCLALVLCALPMPAARAETIWEQDAFDFLSSGELYFQDGGTCGNNVRWAINKYKSTDSHNPDMNI